MTKNKKRKGYYMFKNKKKSKKQKPTLLHVEIKNNSVERALSEFKKELKIQIY